MYSKIMKCPHPVSAALTGLSLVRERR